MHYNLHKIFGHLRSEPRTPATARPGLPRIARPGPRLAVTAQVEQRGPRAPVRPLPARARKPYYVLAEELKKSQALAERVPLYLIICKPL